MASFAERLARVDEIKRKDFATFSAELDVLGREPGLTSAEREHLEYLQGWRAVYKLEYDAALQRFDALIGTAADPAIRQRASASRINALTLARRYGEAFGGLNVLLEQLPSINDPIAREQILGISATLLAEVAEYEQAARYATQMRTEGRTPWSHCASGTLLLDALAGQERLRADDSRITEAIRDCDAAGEPLPAGLARSLRARLLLNEGQAASLLPLLNSEFEQFRGTAYPRLLAEYQVLLAKASLQLGRLPEARSHATAALEAARSQQAKPQVDALQVLYRIERTAGNLPQAINWLERYHEARQRFLDDVGVRQMAYQRVRSEAIANRMRLEALEIEQRLKDASLENTRLSLVLALLILAAVLIVAWRIWLSRLHFRQRAECDGLTGIANRTHFLAVAEQRLKLAERHHQPVALLIIDLDHFKAVNDTWGHPAGDQVLRQATAVWVAALKPGEWLGRLGGEEFALLLVSVTPAEARSRADALRAALARERVELGDRAIGITASFGVATNSDGVYAIKQLLIRADKAMYRAKQEGRDRVVAWAV